MKIDSNINEKLIQQLLEIQKQTLKGIDQLMAIPQSRIVKADYKTFFQKYNNFKL